MSTFLRLRLGPFVHYSRLGRTQAQKKAAWAAQEQREKTRTNRRGVMTRDGTVTSTEPGALVVQLLDDSPFPVTMRVPYQGAPLAAGQRVELKLRSVGELGEGFRCLRVSLRP